MPTSTLHLLLLLPFLLPSTAKDCSSDTTFSQSRLFNSCSSLPLLGAALHWTYHPSNATLDVAYRAPQSPTGWVAWALNPTSTGMSSSQALIAFRDSTTGAMTVFAVPVAGYSPDVVDGNLSFRVFSKEAEFENDVVTIYATVELPENRTTINHVWQAGTQFTGGVPSGHVTAGDNGLSTGMLDLLSGESTADGGENSRQHRKNAHGIANALSWGILMPLGVIMARYMRGFKSADPAWFYLHVGCQCSAYIIGVAGWGTGLKLGSESAGITYHSHRNIGITLFCLGTLQVFALLLRPHKDHKYRVYWNVYHHCTGYMVIFLSVVNVFKGFDALKPDKKWKRAYSAVIVILGGIATVLEVATWVVVLKRRSRGSEKYHSGANGVDGGNGYDGRHV